VKGLGGLGRAMETRKKVLTGNGLKTLTLNLIKENSFTELEKAEMQENKGETSPVLKDDPFKPDKEGENGAVGLEGVKILPINEKEKSISSEEFDDKNDGSDESDGFNNLGHDFNSSPMRGRNSYIVTSPEDLKSDNEKLDKQQPEDYVNDTEDQSVDQNKNPGLFYKIKSLFQTFPSNKKNIKEYYLCKMTSMYSKNFRIALSILIALKLTEQLLLYVYEEGRRGNVVRLCKVLSIFMYSLLLNGKFIQRRPTFLKVTLMVSIIFDFILDLVDFYMKKFTYGGAIEQ
jgi:hypothetical protein